MAFNLPSRPTTVSVPLATCKPTCPRQPSHREHDLKDTASHTPSFACYRYFPEPDLPPLVLTEEEVKGIAAEMEELPKSKRDRFLALGE